MPEDATDDNFNIEEYDEAMAAYTDARQKTNQTRLARSFYPVVAMV